jgi:hypothetical protein
MRILHSLPLAFLFSAPSLSAAPAAPGPYEWLPFHDPLIIEAWTDLLAGSQIADWSGWTGSSWISPQAYNGHEGTDFSMPTGTPVYAAADGQVVTVVTNIPENTGSSYGNYVEIAVDGLGPLGQQLNVITAHLLPTVQVTVGQHVTAGQLIAHSDNTGNSTSEHCHFQSSVRGGATLCHFYNGLCRYPIMFNPETTIQVGHVLRVSASQTTLRADRFDSSAAVTTAHRGQMFFASFPKRGHWQIFLPNSSTRRSAWLRATDAEEVYEGTVIQALPDAGTYVHAQTLAAPIAIRAQPSAAAAQTGSLFFGGGRFVADQVSGEWYRIPVPGSASWGWVLPTSRVIVYPQLINPAVNPANLPDRRLPVRSAFTTLGLCPLGRPKFQRPSVVSFTPAAPSGDGLVLFLSDYGNYGDGPYESVAVGRPSDRDVRVQADIHFDYQPSQGGYERYGIFTRDDGFGGMDQTFEGAGNCYAMTWDTDDGRLRAARIDDGVMTDFLSPARYIASSGWHTFRIDASGDHVMYYLDGSLLIDVTDTSLFAGVSGLGYSNHTTSDPADRGGRFDNFSAEALGLSGVAVR